MCDKLNRLRKQRDEAYDEVSILESYLRDARREGKPTTPIVNAIESIHRGIKEIDQKILQLLC